MDLGRGLCGSCGQEDHPFGTDPLPLLLPDRWEVLYSGKYALQRLVVGLGDGPPKGEG